MGLEKYMPWKDIETYLDYRLKKAGTSLTEMKKAGVMTINTGEPLYYEKGEKIEFDTESGKVEIYSSVLEDAGFDPLPKYKKHKQPEEGFYRLLTGRSPMHSFSRTVNNPILTQLTPDNEVWINPNIAREWDIKNGQYIKLKNQDDVVSTKIRVKVTERIRQDAIYMVHGFGTEQKQMRRAYMKGASDSLLSTRVLYDDVMGGTGFRGNFVTFIV